MTSSTRSSQSSERSSRTTSMWKSWEPYALIAIALAIVMVLAGIIVSTSHHKSGLSSPKAQIDPALFSVDSYGLARRTENSLSIGSVDAPVVLIDYSDMRCPYCAKWMKEIEPELVKRYVKTGKLRIEFRNMVIFGEESRLAARAVMSASEQGRGYQMVKEIFSHMPSRGHGHVTVDQLPEWGKKVGVLNVDVFVKDAQTTRFDAHLAYEKQQAETLGIQSVPGFIINGYPVLGAQPLQYFIDVIESALLALPED